MNGEMAHTFSGAGASADAKVGAGVAAGSCPPPMIFGTTNTATTTMMQRSTAMPTTHHIQRGEWRFGAGCAVKDGGMADDWA